MHYPFRSWFWIPVALVVIPSTIIHIKLLIAIRSQQNSKYKSLFYRLFVSIIELFLIYLYLAGRLLIKDQLAGRDFILSMNGTVLPPFYYYGTMAYFFNVQVWGVMMHSLVRFACTCAPFLKKKLESIPSTAWFLINTLAPFAVMFRFLLQDPVYFTKDREGLAAIYAPPHVVHANAVQSTIVTVIGSVFSATCYAFVLRQLLRFRKVQGNTDNFRHEKMLTIVGFVLFLSQCTMTACYVTTMVAHDNITLIHIVRSLIIFPVVLVTFVNSWMLMVTNGSLRNRKYCLWAHPIENYLQFQYHWIVSGVEQAQSVVIGSGSTYHPPGPLLLRKGVYQIYGMSEA